MGKELQRLSEEIQNKYLVVSGSTTGKQADAIVNMTDQEARAISGSNVSVNKVDTVSEGDQVESGDVVNIAKQLGKCIVDVLRDHGDDLATVTAKNAGKGGVTIKVRYKPDDQGETWEDEFKFTFQDEMVRMENGGEVIDICPLTQQSGTASLSKDLVKDKLKQFIETKGDIETSSEIPADNAPEGLPVDEEQLWESEECYQGFCTAVDQYRQSKDKESVKALLKSSRGFRGGNSIQEKFKNAVQYYKERHPQVEEVESAETLPVELPDEQPVQSPSDVRVDVPGTISISPSLLIRLLEYAREDVKDDVEIHDIVEKLSRVGGTASMDDYESLISTEQPIENPQPEPVSDEQPEGTLEEPEVPEEEPQMEALGDYDEETDRIEGYPEIGDTYTVGGIDFTVIDVAGDRYVLQSEVDPHRMFTWKPGEDLEQRYRRGSGSLEEKKGVRRN